MTDCVYHAFADHMRYFGLEPSPMLQTLFRMAKFEFQSPDEYTWGGIVPFLVEHMCFYSNMRIVAVQHNVWTPEFYEADAPNEKAARYVGFGQWGEKVRPITLQPAIYALHLADHAVFATEVPKSYEPILAIQLAPLPSVSLVTSGSSAEVNYV